MNIAPNNGTASYGIRSLDPPKKYPQEIMTSNLMSPRRNIPKIKFHESRIMEPPYHMDVW